jgi:hypothetical protein
MAMNLLLLCLLCLEMGTDVWLVVRPVASEGSSIVTILSVSVLLSESRIMDMRWAELCFTRVDDA